MISEQNTKLLPMPKDSIMTINQNVHTQSNPTWFQESYFQQQKNFLDISCEPQSTEKQALSQSRLF